jgi:hypothetical protein
MKFRTARKLGIFWIAGKLRTKAPAPTLGGGNRSGERDYDNL